MSYNKPIRVVSTSWLDTQLISDLYRHRASPSSVDEAYFRYKQALRRAFDYTQSGRLVEASRQLDEISVWLVTNARDFGLLCDDPLVYPDHLQFWNDFNICWLAIFQRQELTRDNIAASHLSAQTRLLSQERLEIMGKDLIHLCDQFEQHGLVNYQMGIWEEEILSGMRYLHQLYILDMSI